MRRAVVHDPEDPRSPSGTRARSITCSTNRPNGSMPVLASQRPMTQPAPDVPGRQVLQGPAPLVLVLDPRRPRPGPGPSAGMAADARLDARLLVGADDAVSRVERLALPRARVQVEDPPGLLGELRVAREDPVLVPPRLDGVGVEDAPDGAAADRLAQGRRGPAPVRSARDWRLKGNSVWETVSQAMALTTASSRGGKGGLASASGLVVQGEVALAQRRAPVADRVGVQADLARQPRRWRGRAVGEAARPVRRVGEVGSGRFGGGRPVVPARGSRGGRRGGTGRTGGHGGELDDAVW